ncbi:MAG: PLDc N-terminal domain-containing protein [Lacibacter sp.]
MKVLEIPFGMFEGSFFLLFLLLLAVWCIALVAIANGRFNDNTTKLCWFLIVLFLNVIGVLLFVFWGRKEVYSGSKATQ